MDKAKRMIWMLYAALAVYFFLDGYHTYLLLNVGLREANPIVNAAITQFGQLWGLIVIKVVPMAFLFILLKLRIRQIGT